MALRFDGAVSLGNLLSIAVIIGSVSLAYAKLDAGQQEQNNRLDRLEQSDRDSAAARSLIDGRVRAAEITLASQSSDLRNILQAVNEIKAALDRQTREGR